MTVFLSSILLPGSHDPALGVFISSTVHFSTTYQIPSLEILIRDLKEAVPVFTSLSSAGLLSVYSVESSMYFIQNFHDNTGMGVQFTALYTTCMQILLEQVLLGIVSTIHFHNTKTTQGSVLWFPGFFCVCFCS